MWALCNLPLQVTLSVGLFWALARGDTRDSADQARARLGHTADLADPRTETKTLWIDRMLKPMPRPKQVTNYTIWTSQQIEETLQRWQLHYPDLISVDTAQDAYDFPAAGGPGDCPFHEPEIDGCLNYFATIQDFITYPEGSEASKRLPSVLLSGCLHGNERVGPSSIMELTTLLLEAASCTALPRWSLKDNPTEWENDLNRAKECRQEWKEYGYEDWQRIWLARLVATRRIVIIPTTNALGYYQNRREEAGVDPNRDFPFDLTDPSVCMQTIAGRMVNELFREHIFQMSLTFHAGTEVVSYEWGAPTYSGGLSPDDVAQAQIGQAYSRFADGFSTTQPYEVGTMNDLVYPVRGGMEDWAYAGSWDPDRVIQCQPATYGGYPAEKTKYDSASLRAFNMLIETSHNKQPTQFLGSSLDIFNPVQAENGHVARNLRLALLAVELVQPWAGFRQVNELVLTDDIIPNLDRSAGSQVCQKAKHVVVPRDSKKATIQWEVGGSLTIEETRVWYGKWSDLSDKINCIGQPDESITKFMQQGTAISKTYGTTRYAQRTEGFPHFSASIDISSYKPHDLLVVLVSARVDQEWIQMPSRLFLPKNTAPQSHIANARTNPQWFHESTTSGERVEGRLEWFSDPLTIEVSEIKSATSVQTVELSQRVPVGTQTGVRPTDGYPKDDTPKGKPFTPAEKFVIILIVLVACIFALVGGRYFLRIQMRHTHRDRLREFIADPTAPSPGLKERRRRNGRATEMENGEGNGDLELRVVYKDNEELA